MATTVLVSIICSDRVGLVSSVTGELFDIGVNLGDTTFAVLGGSAKFTAVCPLPDDITIEQLNAGLKALDVLTDAEVVVSLFELSPVHGETARITHRISVKGGNKPGLIARLSEVFVQFEANIVRLNSKGIPGGDEDQYEVRIAAWIPPKNAKSCLATIANTAGELKLSCAWDEA